GGGHARRPGGLRRCAAGRPRGARAVLRSRPPPSPSRRGRPTRSRTRRHLAGRLGHRGDAAVIDVLGYDFMIRALLAAVFTGLSAPVVGTYLVQRRLSLMGDG